MLPIESLLAFALIYTIDSVTPGPAVAMVTVRGATMGVRRTAPFIMGLVVGDLFLFAIAAAGLIALAATLGPLFFIIKWVGVVYLLYLAYQMWNAAPIILPSAPEQGEGLRSFCIATLLPLGNPKAVGFYIALLPTILDVSGLTPAAYVELSIAVVVIWSASLFGYAAAASRAGKLLKQPKAQRVLNRCSACTMVGVAGTIAVRD
ncbi:MAG: LysE family translocator [Hyphomicrobiales bacterium]